MSLFLRPPTPCPEGASRVGTEQMASAPVTSKRALVSRRFISCSSAVLILWTGCTDLREYGEPGRHLAARHASLAEWWECPGEGLTVLRAAMDMAGSPTLCRKEL